MELNTIERKKVLYSISPPLRDHLRQVGRVVALPTTYDSLLRYTASAPVYDRLGRDTLWETTIYDRPTQLQINEALARIYALLRTDGDLSVMEHLYVDRIDYCTFGNTHPFRVRIVNRFNDNHDYFYVKRADASRIYGLELEHLLSPNQITYFVDGDTLVEEHIAGVPGDDFMRIHFNRSTTNKVRLAKEFVKFNERCFVRLLGDMRAYNYVIDITPDLDQEQYRVRAIDFDQQSYEGRVNIYRPQFYKDNLSVVQLCLGLLNHETIVQYQYEERILIGRRVRTAAARLQSLLDCMKREKLSSDAKIAGLRAGLAEHYGDDRFLACAGMGEIVELNISAALEKSAPSDASGEALD